MNRLIQSSVLVLGVAASVASAATFTTSTLIDAANTSYEGQDIVVNGCTLTVNGPHSFNSLLLTNAAVLAHPPAPNGETANQVSLTIAQDLTVDGTSRIDASGLGYASAAGPGTGGNSTTSSGGGGGHAGLGGVGPAGAGSGSVYDTIVAPVFPGSGGGNGYFSSGGNGGGMVRLTIGGALRLNGGVLKADGMSGGGSGLGGAGSGGSIVLTVSQLAGFGSITANGGGAASGGGGGGGCIAITCANNVFAGSIAAHGGPGFQYGGAGTVFIKIAAQPVGDLRVDNGGNPGQMTPLLSPALYNLTIANWGAVYPLGTLTNANVTVKSNGLLTHLSGQSGINLAVLSNLVVELGGRIDVSGNGFLAGLGPGAGSSSVLGGGGGAGHGGNGGNAGVSGGSACDSLIAPAQPGSGGGNGYFSFGGSGGGAAFLTVSGTLRVEGVLKADGTDSYGFMDGGGGAGGSLVLTVGTLAGGGLISANGGAGAGSGGGGGAGGRIALFLTSNSFSGGLTAYGGAGASRGGAGTIFTLASGATDGQVLIDNGGNPGGLTRLNTSFWPADVVYDLTVAGAARMIPDMPLTFGNFVVTSGATVTHDVLQNTLQIVALQDARIDAGSSVNANGLGYGLSSGPGAGGDLASGGGGGGGYGAAGGTGLNGGLGGGTYGSASQPLDFGSGGGAGYVSSGGAGGGFIRLSAGRIMQVNGTVSANGAPASQNLYGGGGSGGSIFLTAGILSGSGLISANGGAAYLGGGGGGGRIATYGGILVDLPTPPTVAGGLGGDGSNTNRNGRAGTIFASTNLPPFQVVSIAPSGPVTHSVSSVAVTFNAGVNSNSFSLANVVVATPTGQIPQNQITVLPAGGPVFTVGFPAQTAAGAYTVTVGPHIQDLFGREMDQNGNGTWGEAGDVYAGGFVIAAPVTISGTVRLADGTPVPNVMLQAGSNASTVTAANGSYTLSLPQGWTGIVTPRKTGCVFSPPNRSYTNLAAGVAGQDYTLTIAFAPALQVAMGGSSLRVQWSSLSGIQYQMQTSADLVTWVNAGQSLAGTGGILHWDFDATSNPCLFVRVLANN